MPEERDFDEDVAFLKSHVRTIVLHRPECDARIAVVPEYQGRVMTSATTGSGTSFGWINYDQVAQGLDASRQINVVGGEERFWLGPEGGQYGLFFAPGAPFDFGEWSTPPLIDTVAFDVIDGNDQKVSLRRDASIQNYSSATFKLRIDRTVLLLAPADAKRSLATKVDGLELVGYRTTNRVTNTGERDWSKDSGLLSIWLLGMYKPGPKTTVVIPFVQGPTEKLGPIVNDDYFGEVPSDRLKIDDGVIYFAGDGNLRSKIGVSPQRSKGICGSYDAVRQVLTVVKYTRPDPLVADYVNSAWQIQDKPYRGDAINSYNDGPPEPGAEPLGPFYELETSSPALPLSAGESATHVQETYHIKGPREMLNALAIDLFGVGLGKIEEAL